MKTGKSGREGRTVIAGQAAARIRPVRSDDVARLVQLTLAAFRPIFPSFRRMLGRTIYRLIWPDWRQSQRKGVETLCRDRAEHVVLVAEIEGRPVGFIAYDLNRKRRTGEVQLIAVDPACQNRGIGTALNVFALAKMRKKGVRLVHVDTGGDDSHAPARRAYEKAGYVRMPLVRYFRNL